MSEALKQKYAHLTLEHLESLDEGQLGDLEHQITQERKVLEMQLEALQAAGGVSRDMANSYIEYLPKEMALESFTGQLTRTNYDMSVESLSTALKVVAAVAIVAGLGTLVWMLTRAGGKGGAQVKEGNITNVKRVVEVRNDLGELVSKTTFANDADFQKAQTQARSDLNIDENADRAMERIKSYGQMDKYTWYNLTQFGGIKNEVQAYPVVNEIYPKLTINILKDIEDYLVPAVNLAEKMSKGGSVENYNRETAQIRAHLSANAVFSKGGDIPAFDVFARILNRAKEPTSAKTGLNAGWGFIDWANEPAYMKEEEVKELRMWLGSKLGSHISFKAPDFSKILKELEKSFSAKKLIEAQEERLKKLDNVPKDLVKLIEEFIDGEKKAISILHLITSLIDLEIASFNRMVSLIGKEVANDVKDQIAVLESMTLNQDIGPETRKLLREAITKVKRSAGV